MDNVGYPSNTDGVGRERCGEATRRVSAAIDCQAAAMIACRARVRVPTVACGDHGRRTGSAMVPGSISSPESYPGKPLRDGFFLTEPSQ